MFKFLWLFCVNHSFTYLLVLLTLLLLFKIYSNITFKYWKRRNVPELQKLVFLFGGTKELFFKEAHVGETLQKAHLNGKANGLKHVGNFLGLRPFYLPIDIEYIKNILQRDYNYFIERGFYYNEKDDPLSANLFAIGGEKWKTVRAKLSQTFTTGKLKLMFEGLLQCADQMEKELEKSCKNRQPINIGAISECFTIDVIGSCVFGLACNSFKNPESDFRKYGKKIFHFTLCRAIKIVFAFSNTKLARLLGVTLFDKDTTQFFINMVKDALKYRQDNCLVRKDFLQLLVELKEQSVEDNNNEFGSIENLTAQAFIFFAAGFETSSITLAFCLYELSMNINIQEKVRREIHEVLIKYEGKLTYEAISDLKYTNQVVEETLRKYPPVSFLTRDCVKDYKLPDENIIIENGMQIVISVLGLHHDPEFYPQPDKFDPERFSDSNRFHIRPFTYIPFGEGPRICIGLRFGMMQVKVGLVALLKNYRFLLNNMTEVPLKMKQYSFTMKPKHGIFLNVKKYNMYDAC